MIKIALIQLDYHIGNFELNTRKILESIHRAKADGVQLVVFSELAVCGYPPRDFLQFDDFIKRCEQSMAEIASQCVSIAAIVGGPSRNLKPEGKNLHNSAWYMAEGKVQNVIHKSLLPTYDVFDEYRYFEPNREFETIELQGHQIALTICEDLWDLKEDPLYTICPMDYHMDAKPGLMINIAASPFSHDHAETRKKVLVENAQKYGVPLIYVNHTGAQTELIFDGGSCAHNGQGDLVCELNYFEEDYQIVEWNPTNSSLAASTKVPGTLAATSKIERIHNALILGIKDYFKKLGFTKAILGLSGGIDSAVVCALAAKALGPENVNVLLMPSQFSSQHSVDDAEALVRNLGITQNIVHIEEVYKQFASSLKPMFEGHDADVAEENIQARIRGVMLMAMSNKFGHILLNTSNKSELAVGYGTLYGDMCGGLAVIGDIYKTEVYELAHFINSNAEIIPQNSITKPPSAELRLDQKDTDSLPEYDLLDRILFQYIEEYKSPGQIIASGFEKQLVERVLKMVNTNEYKRHQTPPILRVSNKAFGMGRRMPIVGKYLS